MAETRVIITAEAQQAIQEFNRLRAEASGSLQQIAAAGTQLNRTGVSAAQTAAALRQVPAQFTDIVTSLQAGQAPLTVLLQQGGQLRDSFGGAGAAARAMAGYVVGLVNPLTVAAAAVAVTGVAYNQARGEANAFQKALALSGNTAGMTVGQLNEMSAAISKTSGTQAQAAAAVTALVGTGKIGAESLERFGSVAVQSQKMLGITVGDTAKAFADLGTAPLETSKKLDEQYNYLTLDAQRQIKALQEQGQYEQAAALAQSTFADAMETRNARIKSSMGTLETAWAASVDGMKGAWDAFVGVFRADTLPEQIAKAEEKLKKAQAARFSFLGGGADGAADVARAAKELQNLKDTEERTKRIGAAQAENARAKEANLKWDEDGVKYLTREEQLQRDLTKARNMGLATATTGTDAAKTERKIAERQAAIRKSYSDIYNAGIDGQIEAIKRRGAVEDIVSKRSLDLLTANKEAGIVTEQAYLEQVGALDMGEFAKQKARLQEELALTKGKQNSNKDQAALRGQIAETEAQAVSRQLQLSNDLYVLQAKGERAVMDQILASTAARNDMNDAMDVEYQLYGKNADAHAFANVALKSESELKKQIAAAIRDGKPLSDETIGQLRAEKEMRDKVTVATMAQTKALGYAQQLHDENRKFTAEAIFDERARNAALLQIDAQAWQERISLAGEGTEAQRKLQEEYAVWYQNQLAKPQIEEQKKIWGAIESTAHDTFVSVFDSGKSAFDRLAGTLKNGLLDLLYQMTVKKWIFQIGASVTGYSGLASTAAQASGLETNTSGVPGSVGSAFSAVSTASSLYKAISGGFEAMQATISTSVADGVQAAMYATGQSGSILTNSAFATSAGNFAGAAAGNLAGIGAGHVIGNAISGDYSVGGHGQAVVNVSAIVGSILGGPIGSILGGPIGGAIGGAVGGLINRAFGMGSEQVTSRTWAGTLSDAGASGDSIVKTHQDGGWFRGDKDNKTTTALTTDITNTLAAGFTNLKQVTAGFAKDLGASSAALDHMSTAFNISLTEDATKNQDAIAAFFAGLGDQMAVSLVPTVAAFSKSGETASATLQRLAGEFESTTQAATLIGRSAEDAFGSVGISSAAAREQLLNFAGGAQQLTAQATSFAQNYLTDAERLAPVAEALDSAMASLGLSGITTRDQFKAVVQGLDLTTEAGNKELASLLALSDAFAQVHPQIEATTAAVRTAADILSERKTLQDQYDQLTMTSAQLLAKQRDVLDESNRALFDQVHAEQAAKDAVTASASAAAAAAQVAADAIAKAQAAASAATASLGNSLVSSMNAAKEAAAAFRSLNDALVQGTQSTLSPEAKYAAAKQQYRSASGSGLQAAEQALLTASKEVNGDSVQYARDFAEVYARNSREAAAQDAIPARILEFWRDFNASGGISAHANGGVASGWSLVGEQGPELANFAQPARIYTASQTRDMFGSGSDAATRENTAVLQQVLAAIVENTKHTRKTAEIWQRVTKDGNSLQTTVA